MMDSMFGWVHGFGLMWLFPLLIFVVIVALLWSIFSGGRGQELPREPRPGSAREILDRRYAGGEISREEYEEKKRDLER